MPTNRQKTSDNTCHPSFPGDISVESFLQDYWQKKPLLIRNAFAGIQSPLSADELAGLACEPDANARLVFEQHEHGHWYVQHGPFQQQDFDNLPEKNWSLLVTDVEKHIPQANDLIKRFRFIPDWRIDDLMISFAPEGGSVGPHTDAYDVFLIQLQGQRRWMVNNEYEERYLENTELRILEKFTATEEWVLAPGDMLYLPPNVAHHGIAMDECMTCSIGFRAPAINQLVSEYAEYHARTIDPSLFYKDPDLQCQDYPAEITADALSKIRSALVENLNVDDEAIKRWFGEFSSEPHAGIYPLAPANIISSFDELVMLFKQHETVEQSLASKYLFIRNNDFAVLFVSGNSYDVSQHFAEAVTEQQQLHTASILAAVKSPKDQQVLLELYNAGHLLLTHE